MKKLSLKEQCPQKLLPKYGMRSSSPKSDLLQQATRKKNDEGAGGVIRDVDPATGHG